MGPALISRAMILAAGRGTRLRELGEKTPKCLISVGGSPLLEHLLKRLRELGVTSVVLNLHHLPDQVRSYVARAPVLDMEVSFSEEKDELLDTGGGLGLARSFFREEEAFLVHNGDIYTEKVLQPFLESFEEERPDAALLVFPTDDPRGLLFNSRGILTGWENRSTGEKRVVTSKSNLEFFGFGGISVLTPTIFQYMPEPGSKFSLIDSLLKMAEDGRVVVGYQKQEHGFWLDVGTPEKVELLNQRLYSKIVAGKPQ